MLAGTTKTKLIKITNLTADNIPPRLANAVLSVAEILNFKNKNIMTLEQFNNAGFSADTKIKFYNSVYDIFSVDWEQSLIGIIQFPEEEKDMDKVRWIRFENCEIFTEEMETKEIEEKTDKNMALISAFAEHYKNETLKTIPEDVILSFFNA